jgi:hypothetical protein
MSICSVRHLLPQAIPLRILIKGNKNIIGDSIITQICYSMTVNSIPVKGRPSLLLHPQAGVQALLNQVEHLTLSLKTRSHPLSATPSEGKDVAIHANTTGITTTPRSMTTVNSLTRYRLNNAMTALKRKQAHLQDIQQRSSLHKSTLAMCPQMNGEDKGTPTHRHLPVNFFYQEIKTHVYPNSEAPLVPQVITPVVVQQKEGSVPTLL